MFYQKQSDQLLRFTISWHYQQKPTCQGVPKLSKKDTPGTTWECGPGSGLIKIGKHIRI